MSDHGFERVLMAHAAYTQPGGEEGSLANEVELLRSRGHEVSVFRRQNRDFHDLGVVEKGTKVVWNQAVFRQLRQEIRSSRPDVLHVQNSFPALSPSIYYAATAEGVPVVQHIRNFRMTCVNGFLFRDGSVCQDCVGKAFPWPGIMHRCYRSSALESGAVAVTIGAHRVSGTYRDRVHQYVCLSNSQRMLLDSVLPAGRVSVRPNFLAIDPGPGEGGGPALFAGRLSPEKGIDYLLAAIEMVPEVEVSIAGDGPLRSLVEDAAQRLPNLTYLGHRPDVIDLMGAACAVLVTSQWFEGFPRVIIEAFSRGTPVIATRLGTSAEVIEDGVTGWLVDGKDPRELAEALRRLDHGSGSLRSNSRQAFLNRFTADRAYTSLMDVYRRARNVMIAGVH